MPFRVTSFGSIQEEFLKSKKKTSWKNWLLVVLSLASWHHQSTSRVGELSNSGSMRDKRNSQTPEKWRAAPQHSWSLTAVIWGGGRKLNGVGGGRRRCSEKETSIKMCLIHNFLNFSADWLSALPYALCMATSDFIFQLLFILWFGVSECILPHSNCWQVQPCNHLAPEVMRPNEMELEEINIPFLIY